MAELIYSALCSPDGYIEDRAGKFDWAEPASEGHTEREILIGGPTLAAHAFQAGRADQCHLLLAPIVVGGGKQCHPRNVWLELDLDDERRFRNGIVFLRYRTRT